MTHGLFHCKRLGNPNCSGASTAQTTGLASGSTFPIGTTINTFEVTDASGNKTSCSFNVTVNDTEAPKIACPAPITQPNDAGVCGAVVTYTAPVGTDNCSGAVTLQTAGLASGATFPIGTTVNTFEVTDAAGLKTSCRFNVTVNDTERPVVTCPDAITVAWASSYPSATTGGSATATDNCGSPVVTHSDSVAGVCPTVITRTWTATDAAGNASTCQQIITVNNLFAGDGIVWHQPLARNGASEDTDPSAGGTLKYRFKKPASLVTLQDSHPRAWERPIWSSTRQTLCWGRRRRSWPG